MEGQRCNESCRGDLTLDRGTPVMESRQSMIPDLQSSLLCDDVRQERNGKFILIGLFDVLNFPAFPAVFPRLCVVNRWCCGEGVFQQRSRVVNPDGTTLVDGKNVRVRLASNEATATSVEFFLNIRFAAEGVYWVEILLEEDLRLRYPLRARRAKAVKPATPES